MTTPKTSSSSAAGVVKRTNAYFVDPSRVSRRSGWNPRFDFGEIEELAKSIQVNGVLVPIRIKRLSPATKGADFELIDGDRRLTAIEFLIKKGTKFPDGIPAIIVDKHQTDLTSLIQMFEANTGKPFLPLEEAHAYGKMREAGMTLADICQAVGRKQVHVTEILNLLNADPSLKEAAQSGEINKTLAKRIATVAKGDATAQKDLVKKAKAAGNDKAKRRQVLKELDAVHIKKAEAKGKTLKSKMADLDTSNLRELAQNLKKMMDRLVAVIDEMELDRCDAILKEARSLSAEARKALK